MKFSYTTRILAFIKLDYREIPSSDLLLLAWNFLVDGEATYLAQVIKLEKTRNELSEVRARGGAPHPFRFSQEERAEIKADVSGAVRGMETMRGVLESLGRLFPELWIVRNEQYEEARDALRQVKHQVLDMFARHQSDREIWQET